MGDKVSVIIPVYNASRYLPDCLASVRAQTYCDFECICVDDGSTDGSAQILDECAAQDKRFQVIHKPNGGEGGARNAGLAAAKGEWITWLDADDLYAPTRLEEAMRIAALERPDMIRTDRMSGAEPSAEFASIPCGAPYHVVDGVVESQKWGWNTLAPGGMVWLWFVRRELLQGLLFRPELRIMTDAVYSMNVIERLKKVCQSEYAGYFYRDAAGSLIRGARRAGDCVRHMTACRDVWESCHERARELGFLDEVLVQMRNAGEGVVVDWATHRDKGRESSADVAQVFAAFNALKGSGALAGRRTIYRYYGVPLFWWRLTGQIWPIALCGRAIDFARRLRG